VQFAKAAGGRVRTVEKVPWRREFAKGLRIEVLSATDTGQYSVVFDAKGSAASMEASKTWLLGDDWCLRDLSQAPLLFPSGYFIGAR
jgi:hypothetical protein